MFTQTYDTPLLRLCEVHNTAAVLLLPLLALVVVVPMSVRHAADTAAALRSGHRGPQEIALVQSRRRHQTVVGSPDYAQTVKQFDGVEKIRVTLWSRVLAMKVLLTGEALAVGDTPLANTKEQAMQAAANVGLLAALSLTIVWPMTCDATDSLQTNAYILTSPAPVGQVYFVLLFLCSVGLFASTLATVITMIGLSELSSDHQARYFCSVARSEIMFAVKYLVGAGALFVAAAILMLIIVTFGLGIDPGDCAGTDSCPETWPAMVASLVLTLAIGAHGVLVITSAVAKLYKTMAKFSPVVDSDGRASNPAEEYILDAGAAEVWCELHEYLHLNTRLASPVNFKEFLIYRAKGAQALSHRCERLADSLFSAKVKGLILADHQSVCSRLDELRRTDERFADFPSELDVE